MPRQSTSSPASLFWCSNAPRLVLTLFFGCLTLATPAQYLDRLTVDDGLSQGFARSVLQTRDGFLWVATLDGLNRYDGTGFKVFRNDPADPYSLNSDFVLELMEDSRGILWIMTDGGPNLYDPATERFYHPVAVNEFSVSKINPLRNLKEDRFGRIWMVFDREIIRLECPASTDPKVVSDNLKKKTGFFPKNQLGIVLYMMPLDTALWILSEKGQFTFPFSDETLHPLPVSIPTDVAYIWQDTFTGTTWLQGAAGIYRMSNGRLDFYRPEHYELGMLNGWSGPKYTYFFSKTRIHRWQNGVWTTLPGNIPEIILSACEDRNGVLWLGTNAYGLYKVLTGRTHFARYCEGRSYTRKPFEDATGNLWIYSETESRVAGYFRFDQASQKLMEPLHSKPQYYMVNSRNGGYWFLSVQSTLCHIDRPGAPARVFRYDSIGGANITYLLEDHLGRAGFLSDDGRMIFFDPGKEKWQAWNFSHLLKPGETPTFSSFIEDAGGRIWIGSSNGLIEAIPENNGQNYQFRYYGSEAGLSRQRILSLSADPYNAQRLWIGTQHGLNWLNISSGQIEALTLRDGLPNDVIYSILPTNDSILWIGTNSGLLRVNHLSKRWQHFTKNDGLPGSEFNTNMALRLRDGRLVFGGVGGLVIFHPDDIIVSPIHPDIAITEILVNSKPYRGAIHSDLPIRLSSDQNYVSFRFALLDYVNPASNRYQYRLIGANNNWTPLSSDNSVTFSSLLPGHYQLEVRGVNSEGAESKITRLVFTISPPWWRSIWACIAYGVAFFFSAWQYIQWRRGQTRFRETLAAEHREAERLKELDQFKSRLYANITHEFRTPLTVILGVAEQLEQDHSIARSEKISLISRNGEQLLRLVNQMLDWSKLENSHLRLHVQQFEVTSFLQMTAEPFAALAASKGVELECRFPDGALWIEADPDRLSDIVANLLSNAVKFTPSGGAVTLSVYTESERTLCIAVEDTGIGIAPEHLPYIFDRFYQIIAPGSTTGGAGIGLSYAQELAQFMGGVLTAESTSGKGTKMLLSLPQKTPFRITPRYAPGDASGTAIQASFSIASAGEEEKEDKERPIVLLIEDNTDVARYTADCLAGRFAVEYADNGSKGLEKAVELIPDLVISDLMLPGMDGFAICKALKKDPRTSHIPIVLLTARADAESRIQGLQYGADVYLAKPFKKQELLLHLDNLLRLRTAIQSRYAGSIQSVQQTPDTAPPAGIQDEFVQQVAQLIAGHFSDPNFSAVDMQKALHMSSSQLHRKLSALTGKSPGALLRLYRLEQSRRLLLESPKLTVSEIAFMTGFRDANYFIRAFTQEFGTSPGAYRKKRR